MNLVNHTDNVLDVGEKAGKEYKIEKGMSKIKNDWAAIEFGLKPFKNSGTYNVYRFDDSIAILDEHIIPT